MNKQTFSSKSFQEIFDKENRKGKDLEKRFRDTFDQTINHRLQIQSLNKRIKAESDETAKNDLLDEKQELKDDREKCLSDIFESISNNINKADYIITLEEGAVHGKQSYYLEDNPENYFLSKRIQENIFDTYKTKQASRYEILSQLVNLLEDGFPKFVIRTDIKSFYESVPQNKLTNKLKEDNLLSIRTLRFIKSIFSSYNTITGQSESENPIGVPRGVGISAYLSELYMRKADNKVKEIPDLVYYARYVDDIIAVFIPQKITKGLDDEYLKAIKEIVTKNDLTINEDKTKTYNLTGGLSLIDSKKTDPKFISFLGYKIGSKTIGKNGKENHVLSIEMSDDKLKRYKLKIKKAYEHFNNKKGHNRKRAFKLLLARIQFLTSNTRLRNNKSKVFVGIFYSNPFLSSDALSLNKLQNSHKWWISRGGFSNEEKEQLQSFDFKNGFNDKNFIYLPIQKKKYKNHNSKKSHCTNKGILQFGLSDIIKVWGK